MNPSRRALLVAGIAVAIASAAVADQETGLHVSGNVESPLTLTLEDLRNLPARQLNDARGSERGGEPSQTRRYVGVLLRDVLNRAKLVESQPRALRRSIVVATARDGYKAVFSWAELYLSPIGDSVYVV